MVTSGRRQFLVGAGGSLLVAKFAVAEKPAPLPRVGYLSWATPDWQKALTAAFLLGMREHGYVEGENIAIEYRRGKTDVLARFAAELVDLNVNVIVTLGTPAAVAAKEATSKIPIVFTLVTDPVASGIVANLASPGGNITGFSMLAPSVYAKALELLAQMLPRLTRVAVFMDPTNSGHVAAMKDVAAAATALGVKATRFEVRNAAEIDRALADSVARQADAFYVFPIQMSASELQKLIQFSIANRIVTLMSSKGRVKAGGLMSYAVDFGDQVRRTGGYVHKILNGAKPGVLPIEQPTKFELAINIKTANQIGVEVPPSILLRADHVFE